MTLRYLLDTSVVSVPISPRPSRTVMRKLQMYETTCAIASPVWHELVFGFRSLPTSKRRDLLERYLFEVVRPSFPILPYDEAAAEWHGIERARLQKRGKLPAYADGQIAAIAKVHSLVLVTANAKDFVSFHQLEVEHW